MVKNKLFKKLLALKPRFPRKRYNIFLGTTSFSEWLLGLKIWFCRYSIDDDVIIKNYEYEFSKVTGTRYGVSFGSGRMALYSILEALDIKRGDEIIMPAFTCVVVPNALIYHGIKPVYVDIDLKNFNINTTIIENSITNKTRAIYAQHTFGVPCDVVSIQAIAKKHSLRIIEDGAHALGGTIGCTKVGSNSDVAFFSTDHSKTITTYLGGMATTNNNEIAQKLLLIQSSAEFLPKKDVLKIIRTFLLEWIYFSPYLLWLGLVIHKILIKLDYVYSFKDELRIIKPVDYPYPCRLSSMQAQLGLKQLSNIKDNIIHRVSIASWLEKKIGWYEINNQSLSKISWIRYSFLVKDRDAFIKKFSDRFDLGIWFPTIFGGRDIDFSEVGYNDGSCPNAEFVAEHIVNFPTHQRLPLSVIKKEVGLKLNWIKSQIIKE